MDSELGACAPALPNGRDLLIGEGATSAAIRNALADAVEAAEYATLFVYFLEHGHRTDEDFYLIGADTRLDSVDSDSAVAIGQRVKEVLRRTTELTV